MRKTATPTELIVHGLTAEDLELMDEEAHTRKRNRLNQAGGRRA